MNNKDDVHAAISQKTGESRAVIDTLGFELQRDPYYECPIDWDLADAQRNVSLIWQRPTQHTV
jgi:hypothetical protein